MTDQHLGEAVLGRCRPGGVAPRPSATAPASSPSGTDRWAVTYERSYSGGVGIHLRTGAPK